jgi:hypothetical protein
MRKSGKEGQEETPNGLSIEAFEKDLGNWIILTRPPRGRAISFALFRKRDILPQLIQRRGCASHPLALARPGK